MTAQKDLAKEKILHRMWRDNEKSQKNIKDIKDRLIIKHQKFEESLKEKYSVIGKHKHDIEILEEKSNANIERHM